MPESLDLLAARLISQGSHFARVASRTAGRHRPVVAFRVLADLDLEGPQRVGRLASHERLSQPAMTATINRLEADGLVHRTVDPADGRAVVVAITPDGRTELASFRSRAAANVRPGLELLRPEDLRTLAHAADLLERLAGQAQPSA